MKWLVNSGWWLGNGMRSGVTFVSLVFSLSSLVLFSACTDYVSQMEDDFGEWKKIIRKWKRANLRLV